MAIKSVEQLKKIKNKVILVRVDFNVPVAKGRVLDDYKIIQTLPTINYLLAQGARIILISHLGNPQKKSTAFSLKPIAIKLSKLIKKNVYLLNNIKDLASDNHQVVLLENIRFDQREKSGDQSLAKELVSYADYLVYEAFAVGHRLDTSVYLLPDYLPVYSGFQMSAELKNLNLLLSKPQKLVAVMGGAKISTKITLLKKILKKADCVLLGGGLANTYLAAQGQEIGISITESEYYQQCRQLPAKKIILPIDLLVKRGNKYLLVNNKDVNKNDNIVDLGPATISLYGTILQSAKMIVWNGPLGLIENERSAISTKELALRMASSRAKQIVGGGETVQVIRQLNLLKYFYFVSTGGGAMLKYLEQGSLPIVKKLNK